MAERSETETIAQVQDAMRSARGAREIRAFFKGDAMLEFVERMQVGAHPWGSTLDHAGRLVVMPPGRECAYAVQVEGDAFAAVVYADALAAFDPEVEFGAKEASEAWVAATCDTPEEAFRALCRELDLDVYADPSPSA